MSLHDAQGHCHHFGRVAQLLVDFHGCKAPLSDAATLERLLLEGAAKVGATVVGQARYEYVPHGVTLVVFLAESHLLISTWPEFGFAITEVMLCNERMDPGQVIEILAAALRPEAVTTHRVVHEVIHAPPADLGGAEAAQESTYGA